MLAKTFRWSVFLGRPQSLSPMLSVLVLGFTVSCATARHSHSPQSNPLGHLEGAVAKDLSKVPPPLPGNGTNNADQLANLEFDKAWERAEVQKWINYFSHEGKPRIQRYLRRGAQYKKQIHAILQKLELPLSLYYIAMIESGFQTDARSVKAAVGFWQFMLPTARNYGLHVTDFVDERRDPLRSTVAAALYLKDLKNVFDSWFLAMAAYNAGQSRIMNVIIRSGTRDFWQLCEVGFIPRQTSEYVPRFLAAMKIGENPEQYGFDVEGVEDLPNLVAVTVPSPVHLTSIADKVGLTMHEFRKYNPHFLKTATPPSLASYRIWVPDGKVDGDKVAGLTVIPHSQFKHHHHTVLASKGKHSSGPNGQHRRFSVGRAETIHYMVRKGDSLDSLAQRFRTTIKQLKRINSLRNSRLYVGQSLKVEYAQEG